MDATPEGEEGKKTVSTADLAVDRVPAQEWAQIFDEVWRRYRDFFYVDEHARLRLGGAARAVSSRCSSTSPIAPI